MYRGPESNRHEHYCSRDFKSLVSTNFTTSATLEASTRFELVMEILQTSALPLGHDAKKRPLKKRPLSERTDSNRRPSRWQRDALPAELLSQNYLKNKAVYFNIIKHKKTQEFLIYSKASDYVHDEGDLEPFLYDHSFQDLLVFVPFLHQQ